MNNIKINILLLLTLLAFSCTQDSDIEIPHSDEVLVLHSIINPDSTIMATLSHTRAVATKEEIGDVKDADMTLYEDGQLIGKLIFTPPNINRGEIKHRYLLDYRPKHGKEYKLVAKKEGYETVESITTLPIKVGQIDKTELVGEFEYGLKNIKVTLKDNELGANYYHLVMYTSSKMTEIVGEDTIEYSQPEYPSYYELKNTSIGDGLSEDNRYGYLVSSPDAGYVFEDELFDNGSIIYNTNVYLPYGDYGDTNIMVESKVRIELRAVNEAYYKYQRSLSLQQDARDNALAEPVFIYNNIDKGFGNFSAYTIAATTELTF